MLRKVQSNTFFVLVHAQADDGVDDLQNDKRADARESDGENHANQLVQKLMRAAGFESGGEAGLTSAFARNPSINIPAMLPTPCTPKTSSESS